MLKCTEIWLNFTFTKCGDRGNILTVEESEKGEQTLAQLAHFNGSLCLQPFQALIPSGAENPAPPSSPASCRWAIQSFNWASLSQKTTRKWLETSQQNGFISNPISHSARVGSTGPWPSRFSHLGSRVVGDGGLCQPGAFITRDHQARRLRHR